MIEVIEGLPPEEKPQPVCVSGMHRSGTSTVAQLLYRCGLYLGDEGDLFAGGPANPDGYWENRHFVDINERIFREYGSGWDLPLNLPRDWRDSDRLQPLRDAAKNLLQEFGRHGHWGWKDPRNCLTLPFWLGLMPDMKVVICLRNPLEVALSLRKRGNSSIAFGLNLWRTYNERLLEATPEGRYVVTHYEAYFYQPQAEIRRVLDFIGVPASDQLISLVRSRVIRGLRNHVLTLDDLLEADPSGKVRVLYLELCSLAGWDLEPAKKPILAAE